MGPSQAPPKRLTRSTRDRMWAGVAGGMAEYFDVDPVLIRLLWVLATIFTGGLAIPLYILLWLVMPRDTAQGGGWQGWNDWNNDWKSEIRERSREFADETRRRVAAEVSGRGYPPPPPSDPFSTPGGPGAPGWGSGATVGAPPPPPPGPAAAVPPPGPTSDPSASEPGWTWYEHHDRREDHPHFSHRQRSAGILLVALGVLVLAANLGVFRWIQWNVTWPLLLVAIGVALLMKQTNWRG